MTKTTTLGGGVAGGKSEYHQRDLAEIRGSNSDISGRHVSKGLEGVHIQNVGKSVVLGLSSGKKEEQKSGRVEGHGKAVPTSGPPPRRWGHWGADSG